MQSPNNRGTSGEFPPSTFFKVATRKFAHLILLLDHTSLKCRRRWGCPSLSSILDCTSQEARRQAGAYPDTAGATGGGHSFAQPQGHLWRHSPVGLYSVTPQSMSQEGQLKDLDWFHLERRLREGAWSLSPNSKGQSRGQGSRCVPCGLKEESWGLRKSSRNTDFSSQAGQDCPQLFQGCRGWREPGGLFSEAI